jgi:hypothetical protein
MNRIIYVPHDLLNKNYGALKMADKKNDLIVLPDVLCAHRKFINTTENNTSDSGFKENLITKLYYKIKLIFIAILRSFK